MEKQRTPTNHRLVSRLNWTNCFCSSVVRRRWVVDVDSPRARREIDQSIALVVLGEYLEQRHRAQASSDCTAPFVLGARLGPTLAAVRAGAAKMCEAWRVYCTVLK
jgi:hypothetical protein